MLRATVEVGVDAATVGRRRRREVIVEKFDFGAAVRATRGAPRYRLRRAAGPARTAIVGSMLFLEGVYYQRGGLLRGLID
jgi:hypothetical protein